MQRRKVGPTAGSGRGSYADASLAVLRDSWLMDQKMGEKTSPDDVRESGQETDGLP